MFPKRQAEIAHDYGRIAAGEVLTPANLIDPGTEPTGDQLDKVTFVLTPRLGDLAPRARGMVEEHLSHSRSSTNSSRSGCPSSTNTSSPGEKPSP